MCAKLRIQVMRSHLLILTFALVSAQAWSQGVNTSIIKQRAREVSGSKQPPLPTSPPPATAGKQGQSAAPAINQAMVSKISANIATIKIRSEASDEQKQKLAKDLTLAAQAGAQASSEALHKLASDLAIAVAGGKFSAMEQNTLARNIAGLLGGQNLSPQVIAAVLKSTKDGLLQGGASEERAQAVIAGLQAIVGGTQKTSTK